jgi:hypothetical protein
MSEIEKQDEVKELEEKVGTVAIDDTNNKSEEDGVGNSILGFEKEDPFKEAGEDAAGVFFFRLISLTLLIRRHHPLEAYFSRPQEIDDHSRIGFWTSKEC